MVIDHIGAILYPDVEWMRIIGRFSFPLFIWLLVQGEAHTRNVWRYGLRLAVLGVISQPIYQLAFGVTDFNILFELLAGLVCLRLSRMGSQQGTTLPLVVWLVGALVTDLLNINYGSYGIALVLLTRYFRPTPVWFLAWVGLHVAYAWLMGPFQLPAAAAPLFFLLANGQRGAGARWFYLFYPGHLAVLALIAWRLGLLV